MNAIDWITHLNLLPHPEGGYFKEVFRSGKLVDDAQSAMTSIYYLLENEDYSAFHRLTSPEVWYYHAGYPLIDFEMATFEALSGMYPQHEDLLRRLCSVS